MLQEWGVFMAVIIPVIVSGCTINTNAHVSAIPTTNFTAFIVQGPTPATSKPLPELLAASDDAEIAELDSLAKNLSTIGTYKFNVNDCQEYTLNFIGNATQHYHTCRYVSGIGFNWQCHAWAQCIAGKTFIELETMPMSGTFDTTNYGINNPNAPRRSGLIQRRTPTEYISICFSSWNTTVLPSACERSVCNQVLDQKLLNNTGGTL